jgi:predicted NodU family carbamoyl transferase
MGINASHNGAVCLLHGERIVVAIQEERLTRIKRQRLYGVTPALAIAYCLNHAGIEADDLDLIVASGWRVKYEVTARAVGSRGDGIASRSDRLSEPGFYDAEVPPPSFFVGVAVASVAVITTVSRRGFTHTLRAA